MVSLIVVVPKSNGKVRICVDLTKLNTSVCREHHILPSVEQTLAQVGDAKYCSKLDANSGFWQIELAPESSKLTTFITPFGRYAFNRLPFGITSAPEHFQRKMSGTMEPVLRSPGLSGHLCITAMVTRSQIFSHTNVCIVVCIKRSPVYLSNAYNGQPRIHL